MHKIQIKTYPEYFKYYFSLVEENDLIPALEDSLITCQQMLLSIPSEKMNYAYAPEKWNIKRLLLHIIDAERIFAYRALSISRGEKGRLPGFDENDYANASHEENLSNTQLIDDYILNRKNSIHLFKSFSPSTYQNIGNANSFDIELGAIGFGILGHELHHFNVLKERYLR